MALRTLILLLTLAVAACATKPNQQLATQDDSADAALQRSLTLLRQNDLRAALAEVQQAMRKRSDDPSANNIAGLIYERSGDMALADTYFKRAVTLAPDDAYTHNNYGTFLCQQGRIYEAEEQFLAAVYDTNYKTPEIAYTNAGICVQRIPDLDRAAQYFRAALDAKPDMPGALYHLAKINYQKDRVELARQGLSTHLQVAPESAKALFLGAQIERALGNEPAAAAYEFKIREKFTDSEEYQRLLQQQ